MNSSLVFGLYCEGASDYRFLAPILNRTLQQLIPQVELYLVLLDTINHSGQSQDENIKRAAHDGHGFHLVVIHLDADAPDEKGALNNRFEPGRLVAQATPRFYNANLVPIIPVRNTNAWMLVDFAAFRDVVGTDKDADVLGFPKRAVEVEKIFDPKHVFSEALKNARPPRRRHQLKPVDVFTLLAQKIDMRRLTEVPSYLIFHKRLTDLLHTLHYL